MKITHRVPVRAVASDPVTPDYQAEVDRCTAQLERRYAQAAKRLEAAERRALRAEARSGARGKQKMQPARLAALWADVERRRAELAAVQGLMAPAGASKQHLGRKSYRPVPVTRGVAL